MTDNNFRKLVKSMRQDGLKDPAIQYVEINSVPHVVVGNNRLTAARFLGETSEFICKKVSFPIPRTNFHTEKICFRYNWLG
ncbi:ParB N-terminal domain-containing protein [Pseudomonas flavescens]|uniref:ParB N-terminal domain-containing protein n=1 Tax=Pseudomonas sp. BIGb0408 TaxID=2940559 RepID=UPI0015CD0AF6